MKNQKFICLFLIFASLTSIYTTEFTEEEGVTLITAANIQDFLQQNKYALIEFVAPWCGHCKDLVPKFQKAAVELKAANPPVALGKVDATAEAALAEEYKVEGYPTLYFFIDGVKQEYSGGRTTEDIVKWCQKKTNFQLTEVNTDEELKKLTSGGENVFVFFGAKGSDGYQTIEDFAKVEDIRKLSYAFSPSASLAAAQNVQTNTLVLFKNFDEAPSSTQGPLTHDSIKAFYNEHGFPVVREFNYESAASIFEDGKSALILLTTNNTESDTARQNLNLAAKTLKGKVIMTESRFEGELGDRLAEFLGIEQSTMPQFRILSFSEDNTKKYVLTGEHTEQNIIQFYEDWSQGKLQPFFKSEPVPDNTGNNVKVVVGLNFEELVANSKEDVLLEFYAPWCGHCQQIAPKYDRVGELFKSNPNIVIAKCDATANEIESVAIEGFPTIKFFPANNKTHPIDYDGPRNVRGFVEFLQKHTTHPWVDVAMTEEEKNEEEVVPEESEDGQEEGQDGEQSGEEGDIEEGEESGETEEKNPEL